MKPRNDIAMKDWAPALELMGRGELVGLLRKHGFGNGDAGEEEHREFFLFPSYEALKIEHFRPEWQSVVEDTLEHQMDGRVRFQYYAMARAEAHVADWDHLHKLEPFHPYTSEYVEERFMMRPFGFYFLVLRVFELPAPLMLVDRPMYEGRQRWLRLETQLPTKGAHAVKSRDAFERDVHVLKSTLL